MSVSTTQLDELRLLARLARQAHETFYESPSARTASEYLQAFALLGSRHKDIVDAIDTLEAGSWRGAPGS